MDYGGMEHGEMGHIGMEHGGMEHGGMDYGRIETMSRLQENRARLLCRYPFWGTLLLHLQMELEDCGTAYTDMERLVFDPAFADRLDDEQIQVVMMHEVMHCALAHCSRAASRHRFLYNVACDIVVNSTLLWTLGYDEFEIDGQKLMHTAPDNREGREYTAEEVYDMLLREVGDETEKYTFIDRHDPWNNIMPDGAAGYEWREHLQDAARYAADDKVSWAVRDIMEEYQESKVNWVQLLHRFLQQIKDNGDYGFNPGDRRYSDKDFIIPAFCDEDIYAVENLWFCIDTSASVTDQELCVMMGEIMQALTQFEHFKARLSFFDCEVTAPVEFGSAEELRACRPVGGGGTSFSNIFRYMQEHSRGSLPEAVIIMTDGYARFPEREETLEVPVLWILINSEVQPPWGETVHICTKYASHSMSHIESRRLF